MQRVILFAFIAACLCFTDPSSAQEPARDRDVVPEDYFDLATILACDVSPDGKMAAYVESRWGRGDEGRKNDLWVADIETRERRRLTFDAPGPGEVAWSPDGRWIYYLGAHRRAGETKPPYDGKKQVWRITADGGEPFAVTRVEDGVKSFGLHPGGDAMFYAATEKVYAEDWKGLRKEFPSLEYGHGVSRLDALFKLDLLGWRTEKVRKADRVVRDMAVSPDGERLALIATADNELIFHEGWSRLEVLSLASGEIEEIVGEDWRRDHPSPYGWLEDVCWADDGGAVAFSISYDGYASRVFAAEWSGGAPVVFEIERPGVLAYDGGLTWRGRSRTLCFRGEEKARVRVCAVENVRNGGHGAVGVLTPGDVVAGAFSFSRAGDVLAAVIETTTHMNDIFVAADGALTRVTDVNPQVGRWKLPQISIAEWIGADGDPVEGILELPPDYKKDAGPLPLIVELHGGPTASTRFRLRLWIYGRTLMPARGYALLSPNYHGSTGYGDEFTAKLVGRENDIEVIDIRRGIQHLIDTGIADPERIGVMGWSNGGFLTNAMITSEPDLFRAASSGAGVLDQALQWATEDTPGHVINFMQGLPWERPEAYLKASPLYNLHRVKTPTLVHVGGSDPRVPPAHSLALYRGLHHYVGVPVELVVYPGEGHGLSSYNNRLAKMKWDIAWFDKYLLGKTPEPEVEPGDAEKN